MKAKHTDLEKLEQLYKESGNQLVVLYGRRGCQKEELIKEFCDGKKFFYYRCRQASPEHQLEMMGEEISRQYKVSLSRQTYEEYFARIKSGGPSKLVVIIDEAQFVAKRDASFMEAVAKLKKHKLYPGPVLIILATSSTVWATQEAAEQFKGAEMKLESLNFLEVVRHFESLPVAEIVRIYGAIGGVPAYLDKWDAAKSFKDNICRLVLTPSGALYGEADAVISAELRELSAYSTILAAIARGENKLNDIFHATGFSRAKISVYLKNLAAFNIVEKVVSFETGGWENAKKGVYQIKDTFVNFWFKFVYPNMSNLYLLSPEEFYDTYIEKELDERVKYFKGEDKLIEAQRITERTNFDIEMMRETGFCSGIENYTRHLNFAKPGEPPMTLIDFFPDDFLIIVDESHITIPQIGGMYAGDRSRKTTLVDYGFRLPSALDNRPLNFEEFEGKIDQMLFVSATPNKYENEHELLRAEQIIRPTGLLDPEISVRPVEGQIDDLISEVNKEIANHHKVLITTLTKRMAEDLTNYMAELGIRVKYLHSDIDTLERAEIIRDLRLDVFDVLVGINLLREGLDIPEITLVAILDADKEGFLRSETSLIQTIGRAARNSEGHVIMYADKITDSMRVAIEETKRRRKVQEEYNEAHGITPQTIQKSVRDLIAISKKVAADETALDKDPESMSKKELEKHIADIEKKMKKAAAELNFEAAAEYRDKLIMLKNTLRDVK